MKCMKSLCGWSILFIFTFVLHAATAQAQSFSKTPSKSLQQLEAALKNDKVSGKMQQRGWQLVYKNAAGEDTGVIRKKYQALIKETGKPYTLEFGVSKMPTVNTKVITNNSVQTVDIKNPSARQGPPLPVHTGLMADHSISGITPEKAPGGAEVIISGQKFGNDPSEVRVWVNGKAAIIRGISDDQIQIVVPVKAGSGPVLVKVKDQTATGAHLTYEWKAIVTVFAGKFNNHSTVDGPATNARFDHPYYMIIDRFDNIYVWNNAGTKRIINNFAEVSTLASEPTSDIRKLLSKPITSVMDSKGNKYELAPATGTTSTGTTGSSYIKKITPSGRVSILAGSTRYRDGGADGYGDAAVFADLQAIAIDAAGYLYVTERDGIELMNHGDRVRMISPEGRVTTLAGGGPAGRIGRRGALDGVGTDALFTGPAGIVMDSRGNLFVAETNNGVIRKITLE